MSGPNERALQAVLAAFTRSTMRLRSVLPAARPCAIRKNARRRADLTKSTTAVRFPCLGCGHVKFGDEPKHEPWRPRWAQILVVLALVAAAIVIVLSVRDSVLR